MYGVEWIPICYMAFVSFTMGGGVDGDPWYFVFGSRVVVVVVVVIGGGQPPGEEQPRRVLTRRSRPRRSRRAPEDLLTRPHH